MNDYDKGSRFAIKRLDLDTPPGETGGVGLVGKVWVRNLHTEEAGATLADIVSGQTARCILPWIPLM